MDMTETRNLQSNLCLALHTYVVLGMKARDPGTQAYQDREKELFRERGRFERETCRGSTECCVREGVSTEKTKAVAKKTSVEVWRHILRV